MPVQSISSLRMDRIAALDQSLLFPRQEGCLQCDDSKQLACPTCPYGQQCQFTVPVNVCTECPRAYCEAIDEPTATASASSIDSSSTDSVNKGAIAGGVVGGIVFIALATYLVWRFCIKTKRRHLLDHGPAGDSQWEDVKDDDSHHQAAIQREKSLAQRRGSTHTMHSIASTVFTRASNIIQIAYIPGVTNRAGTAGPGPLGGGGRNNNQARLGHLSANSSAFSATSLPSPTLTSTRSSAKTTMLLVPPVPPLPGTASPSSTLTGYDTALHSPLVPPPDDPHFFTPADLRDSTYSALSAFTARTSFMSYAPRSSVASTIYGKGSVIVGAPAQTGMRARPAMVSVKPAAAYAGSGTSTPPVPSIDLDKYRDQMMPDSTTKGGGGCGDTQRGDADPTAAETSRVTPDSMDYPPSPAGSTFSVGSTFVNNATNVHTAKPAKAKLMRAGSCRKITISSSTKDDASSNPASPPPTTATATPTTLTPSLAFPTTNPSPFSSASTIAVTSPTNPPSSPHKNPSSLTPLSIPPRPVSPAISVSSLPPRVVPTPRMHSPLSPSPLSGARPILRSVHSTDRMEGSGQSPFRDP